MWVSTEFIGDDNNEIKNAQHHMYHYLLFEIFDYCRDSYLFANAICGKLNDEEINKIKEKTNIDHRTLQDTHDVIATSYRFEQREHHLTLFEEKVENIIAYYKTNYQNWESGKLTDNEIVWSYKWKSFYIRFLQQITFELGNRNYDFIKHVMNAAYFNPNNKSGNNSEKELVNLLIGRFNLEEKMKEKSVLKSYFV